MLRRLCRFIRSFFTDNRPPPVVEPHHRTREGRIVYDEAKPGDPLWERSRALFDATTQRELEHQEAMVRGRACLHSDLGRHLGRCTLPDGRVGELFAYTFAGKLPAAEETPADPGNGNGEGDSTRGD